VVYLLSDCDEYLAAARLAQLKSALGDAEMADLNTTVFGESSTRPADLLAQASMMPFLSARRMVIANDLLTHLDRRMAASKGTDSAAYTEAATLLTGLPDLPPSSDVVFVEAKGLDKRRHLWKGFKRDDGTEVPGVDALIKQTVIALESLGTPDAKALPGWIQRRAREKSIAIDGHAVQMLGDFVGPNLRQLDNELDKLAVYASGRAITGDDVRLMVSDASEAVIWDLTDALSRRDGRAAMLALADLRRNDANQFYLLTMIARQVRTLIMVKESMEQGVANEQAIAQRLKMHPFPVKKAMQQVRGFSTAELDDVMARLLAADFAMKTGANPDTEIDVLIAELTRKPAPAARR
jgi:DNA polymerase-3 subunit delta